MKRFLTLVILGSLLCSVTKVSYAVTITSSPSASASPSAQPTEDSDLVKKIDNQINKLKEKIASRVAQLKLVEKRGVIGVLTDYNNTQIKVTDQQNNIRIIDLDELTKFSSPSAKGSFGVSDITKGTVLGILGNYNKDTQHILARFVDVLVLPKVLNGVITSVDNKNYYFHIATPDQKDLSIDVESVTKTYNYTQVDGIKKAGFSKLSIGDRVLVVGFPDKKVTDQIIALRVTRFSEIPINPKLSNTVSITPSPSIVQQNPTEIPTPSIAKKKISPSSN